MPRNPFTSQIIIKFDIVNLKFFKRKRKRKTGGSGGDGMSDSLRRIDLSKLEDIIAELDYLEENDDLAPR